MSKTVFTLIMPEPRVRKAPVPPVRAHKNKRLYSRKRKHRNDPRDERHFDQSPAKAGDWLFKRLPLLERPFPLSPEARAR